MFKIFKKATNDRNNGSTFKISKLKTLGYLDELCFSKLGKSLFIS